MIHSLKLVNFRKHAELSVDFTSGLNGIFGPNYTGKTTILYGILFALGGISSVPCKSVYKSNTSTFLTEMTFSIGTKKYKVSRTKSSAKLSEILPDGNEEALANSTSVVNKHIEKLLGMTMKRFCQIRYSKQKFTSALLTLGAAELHNILSDVSGADFVQKVLERLGKMKDRLDYELEGKVEQDLCALSASVGAAVVDLDAAAGKVASASASAAELSVVYDMAVKAADKMNADMAAYTTYENRLHDLKEAEVQASKKLAEVLDDLEALPEAVNAEWFSENKAAQEELSSEIKAVAAVEATFEKLSDRVQVANKACPTASHRLLNVRTQFEELVEPVMSEEMLDLKREVDSLRVELKTLQVKISEKTTEIESGVCAGCNRPFDNHFNPAEAKEELAILKSEFESKKGMGLKKNNDLETLEKIFVKLQKEWQSTQADLITAEKSMALASETLAEAEAELAAAPKPTTSSTTMREKLEVLRSELSVATANDNKRGRVVERETFARATLDDINSKLKALEPPCFPVLAGDLQAAITLRDLKKGKLDEANQQVREAERTASDCKVMVRDLDIALEVARDTNEKLGKLFVRAQSIKALQKFLKDSKDEYMREVWNVLMADASQLVLAASSGSIEGLERTEDGQFSYTEDSNAYNVSEASGAQAAIMGLAVQTALARALPPVLDILLVDEPTADMDDEHSMTFSLLLPSRAAQVICVSHSRMDSSTCNNVIDLG
jgi:DNA repair exonuclease SbcCD ATPase subunit